LRTRTWIGNDVVDLGESGVAGKERDRRFMERVFTPEERRRILDAAEPTLALWRAWSAKETAFKVASKLREGVVFAHRRFEVGPEMTGAPGAGDQAPRRWASVWFEDLEVQVRWETARDYIHCIGRLARCGGEVAPADPGSRGLARRLLAGIASDSRGFGGTLSLAERASVHSTPSERARLLARELMARWDLHGAEIVRMWRAWRWSPPVVARLGEPVAGFDVSLSHDGRFVAAALVGPV
jgi:phosphopantetheinyl transferase (holo-ACP synthase)